MKKLLTLNLPCGFCTLLFLVACEAPSVYTMKQDAGPRESMSVDHIPDAVPREEPRTIAGNKNPYTVRGKTYTLLPSPEGYKSQGIASWYGRKFHGHTTSNGEIYNMYGMTAAHKTLPIPSYVRVTHRENGRSVIVRVNDRGPFHDGRIIDLSYTAAKKLGFVDSGTAPVEVEYIDPRQYRGAPSSLPVPPAPPSVLTASLGTSRSSGSPQMPAAPSPAYSGGYEIPDNTYLQVGAFSSREVAERLLVRLQVVTSYPVRIYTSKESAFFRVRIGPLKDSYDLLMLRETLAQHNVPQAHIVYQ